MLEQQPLRRHGARAVHEHRDAGGAPGEERGADVWEERAAQGGGGVAALPEVALERLQVGRLDVLGGERADVRLERGGGDAVRGGEGVAVGREGGGVPFGGEGLGERGEGVGELEE